MAERRMFAKSIIDSDLFLDMPQSTQNLYFHLSLRADDDGFVGNPKKIMRMINCSQDDIKILISKQFLIPFESGVVVIKHWKIHNYIRNDRYKPTIYTEEKKKLIEQENKEYIVGIPNGNQTDTQYRIGKDSLVKDNKNNVVNDIYTTQIKEVIDYLNEKSKKNFRHTTKKTQTLIKGLLKNNYTVEDIKKVIDIKAKQWSKDKKMKIYLRPQTLFGSKFEAYLNEEPNKEVYEVKIDHEDLERYSNMEIDF